MPTLIIIMGSFLVAISVAGIASLAASSGHVRRNGSIIDVIGMIILIAVGVGMVGVGSANRIRENYRVEKTQQLINNCEKDLPRSQHCDLIAIPPAL